MLVCNGGFKRLVSYITRTMGTKLQYRLVEAAHAVARIIPEPSMVIFVENELRLPGPAL
jgi:hypothetical protein